MAAESEGRRTEARAAPCRPASPSPSPPPPARIKVRILLVLALCQHHTELLLKDVERPQRSTAILGLIFGTKSLEIWVLGPSRIKVDRPTIAEFRAPSWSIYPYKAPSIPMIIRTLV